MKRLFAFAAALALSFVSVGSATLDVDGSTAATVGTLMG